MKRIYLYAAAGLAVLLLIADAVSGDIDYTSWFIGLGASAVVVVLYFRGRHEVKAEQGGAGAPEPPSMQ